MNLFSQQRRRGWLCTVTAAALMLGGMGVARGDVLGEAVDVLKFLFRPAKKKPGVIDAAAANVGAGFVNQYTPLLTKLMMAELHFAHKVCELDGQQLALLQKVGKAKVAVMAKTYENQQNQHQSSEWPDAREALTDAFQEQIDALLPAEAAARYRSEVAARRQAKKDAAREMMVVLIDRKLSLTPDQYEHAGGVINEKWDPGWARNMQMFLYDQYAPLPDANVLSPVLTERQRTTWESRTNHGRISFGWERDLGLSSPWGEVGDLEVDIPAAAEEKPEGDSEEILQEPPEENPEPKAQDAVEDAEEEK